MNGGVQERRGTQYDDRSRNLLEWGGVLVWGKIYEKSSLGRDNMMEDPAATVGARVGWVGVVCLFGQTLSPFKLLLT